MATVTRPQPVAVEPAPAAKRKLTQQAEALDPLRPFFGDRIAFAVWLTCALFMAALFAYDTLFGLFR
jgi:hypothetical protein